MNLLKHVLKQKEEKLDNFFVQTEFKNPITIEQASIPVSEWIKKNNLG